MTGRKEGKVFNIGGRSAGRDDNRKMKGRKTSAGELDTNWIISR